jgi:hypothetical protein
MPSDSLQKPEARRAYRQQLRAISRLLRWSGAALVLLGALGIALGHSGHWYIGPSWVSLLIGWVLVLSGGISRARPTAVDPD